MKAVIVISVLIVLLRGANSAPVSDSPQADTTAWDSDDETALNAGSEFESDDELTDIETALQDDGVDEIEDDDEFEDMGELSGDDGFEDFDEWEGEDGSEEWLSELDDEDTGDVSEFDDLVELDDEASNYLEEFGDFSESDNAETGGLSKLDDEGIENLSGWESDEELGDFDGFESGNEESGNDFELLDDGEDDGFDDMGQPSLVMVACNNIRTSFKDGKLYVNGMEIQKVGQDDDVLIQQNNVYINGEFKGYIPPYSDTSR